jgi:catechol 2,3-dioxygenase-like lactoylglutathione lyase family enzyme
MLIQHLGLTVRDPERSKDFYLTVIGLDAEARPKPWGYRLDLVDGFMLALIQGEPKSRDVAEAVHFGCTLEQPQEVHRLRERLRGAGAPEVEWEDSDGYTGVKVQDPDGYVVELSYDIT